MICIDQIVLQEQKFFYWRKGHFEVFVYGHFFCQCGYFSDISTCPSKRSIFSYYFAQKYEDILRTSHSGKKIS